MSGTGASTTSWTRSITIKKKFGITHVMIVDDTFTIKKERVAEFCQKYAEKIKLPFRCMANPNSVNREMMFTLKNAGCLSVHMGIENGNDHIRNDVMNRHFSKTQIISAFKWAKEAGLDTASYNIIGVPGETRTTVIETINLNRECDADVAQASIYYPFPHTRLWEVCVENGYITDRKIKSYFSDTILDLPTISRKELIALERTFQLYVSLPDHLKFIPFAFEKMMIYSPNGMGKLYEMLMTAIHMSFFSFNRHRIFQLVGRMLVRNIRNSLFAIQN